MIKTDIPIFCKGRSSTRYNHEGEDQTRNNEENKWKYKELQQPRDAKILDSQEYNRYPGQAKCIAFNLGISSNTYWAATTTHSPLWVDRNLLHH